MREIACSLEGADRGSRRDRWSRLRAVSEIDAVPTRGGIRMRFTPEAGVEQELEQLLALERDCCAFADWAIRREGGTLVVEVASDEAGADVLREMFGPTG